MPNTNINDLVSPTVLTNLVRAIEIPGFELADYLPLEPIQGTSYRYPKAQLAKAPAMGRRAWDAEAPIGARQGLSYETQELPPLSRKIPMTEEQFIKQRALETGDWSAYVQQIYDDIENLTEAALATFEIDRGELLGSGTLTLKDDYGNTIGTITYTGFGSATASPLWSSVATADPLSDLTSWVATYKGNNRGLAPGELLISDTVAGYLVRNVAIASALYPVSGSAPSVVSREAVNEYFRAHALPPFRVISSQATKADGTVGAVLAANKVVLVPPRQVPFGKTVVGTTAAALGMVENGTTTLAEAPGLVGLSWDENDPARRWNMLDGCGMAVINDPAKLFIATVAA